MAGAAVVLAVFLVALDAKERDNRFCISCHLHEEKFARLTAAVPADLAALHFHRDDRVGCIACHGGVHPVTRLQVWAVAGLDTVKFLTGLYEEPTGMRLPIGDPGCRRCHTPVLKPSPSAPAGPPDRVTQAAPAGGGGPSDQGGGASDLPAEAELPPQPGTSYHGIRDHDGVKVRCVRCHTSHTMDSDAPNRFISRAIVQPVCRECHREM